MDKSVWIDLDPRATLESLREIDPSIATVSNCAATCGGMWHSRCVGITS